MVRSRNKLYLFLLLACLLGYAWIYYLSQHHSSHLQVPSAGVCLIKNISGIPCPSCGSSRSVLHLLHGDFAQAAYTNPFGLLIALVLLIAPIWILLDIIQKKQSFFLFYKKIERLVSRPSIAGILIVLVLINWIWNISKGL